MNSHFKRCIHFLIDGANERILRQLVSEGKLPNISRYFVDQGTQDKAITCFPSTTGPAFTPIMTGNFPGTCNIPGVRWFDRTLHHKRGFSSKRFRDYFNWGIYSFDSDLSKKVKTIYEYESRSVSILGLINRGTKLRQKAGYFRVPYLFYRAVRKDDPVYLEQKTFELFKQSLKNKPRYTFYYFPIIDLHSHWHGCDSKQVKETYLRVDRDIGQVVNLLKEEGTLDDTLLIITSDHGHENVEKHLDMDEFLKNHFDSLLYFPGPYRGWRKAKAINMPSGNSMTHIYLRGDKDWHDFHEWSSIKQTGLVDSLLNCKEIDFVMGRNEDGSIAVKSKRGEAIIKETGTRQLAYYVTTTDPFGFSKLPQEMNWNESLELTLNTFYPDAILQCVQLFRSSRTGDLVCAASPGCDLRAGHHENPEHRSAHGSLHKEHMIIPLYLNAKINARPKRSADIFATTIDALGFNPQHDLDGHSFLIT